MHLAIIRALRARDPSRCTAAFTVSKCESLYSDKRRQKMMSDFVGID
jgi:hypothetical protein